MSDDVSCATMRTGAVPDVRTRRLPTSGTLVANAAGDFVLTGRELGRAELLEHGLVLREGDGLGHDALRLRQWERRAFSPWLDYLILVPTLRCNLACSYCQVSRVGEARPGYDWSPETLSAVLRTLDELPGDRIKIEFQGGEPTLRPDLIRAVMERCERFERREFVICTNLQSLDDGIMSLFDRPDVFVSTSLDGDFAAHSRLRTGGDARTAAFMSNLRTLVDRHPAGKVSALPTIDPSDPPAVDALIDAFLSFGLTRIFLRPINYQGFARKRHGGSREQRDGWHDYHEAFVRRLIERNWADRSVVLEETYLGICLRRIFQPGRERHVDLRSPNPMGIDYVVVDHDGSVYPTDEARMLARSRVIDLSIGHVARGWSTEARDALNRHSDNLHDPACRTCVYQAFCGRDVVDDVSRYGRIDLPRQETEFCRRHSRIFDLAFELIYSDDPAVRHSLSRWLRLPGTPSAFGQVVQ